MYINQNLTGVSLQWSCNLQLFVKGKIVTVIMGHSAAAHSYESLCLHMETWLVGDTADVKSP